ncbi:MAG: recombination protein RecR [Candidatus Doudnabacteria bacterium Gr01-1014_77]|uniref:Recombination protein RecR n=1 Tax=Candidatus Doudnabacteria bacterium Gr01-1014_77 TaxID=2017133 RepID=A0A554J9V8_9BACT|nr:MAG: recombination protein RecR [Candidatus Doudnabacteria bacterium Gr01-1014_77]
MLKLPSSIEKLINELSKLPGIGPKSASRLTLYLLKKPDLDLTLLSEAVSNLKKDVLFCSVCHNMTETDPCSVCTDQNRDKSILCVVEEPLDAQALDATGAYKGLYHVLGGVLNPLEGIGPDSLNIASLMQRLGNSELKEVILATNPSLEGETTANHIQKLIQPLGLKITRLARGLPIGGDLEYADEITITRALQGRS